MFCPKSWVDPFGKVPIFILCQKDICIAHKAIFSEYQQTRSLRSLILTVFNQNDELTAFEKLAFSLSKIHFYFLKGLLFYLEYQ